MADPPFYLAPRAELLQGDIYLATPSVEIVERPLVVARRWPKDLGQPPLPGFRAHMEDTAPLPQGGLHWSLEKGEREDVIVPASRSMAIVMTHDCEIENEPDFRIVAMIRPLAAVDPEHQEGVMSLKIWPYFPLDSQHEPPVMEPSFVDFRRLTTMRVDALRETDRHAALSDIVREALAERFWLFLFRRALDADARESER